MTEPLVQQCLCRTPARDIRRALYVNTTFMPGSVLIRRTTYLAFGGFNPSIKLVEDWDLWLRLIHAGVIAACQSHSFSIDHVGNQSNNAIAALKTKKRSTAVLFSTSAAIHSLVDAPRNIKAARRLSPPPCSATSVIHALSP